MTTEKPICDEFVFTLGRLTTGIQLEVLDMDARVVGLKMRLDAALMARLREVQQAASDKISTHARDVAIKQAEIELQNVRFAVEQALNHRRSVIVAALEYMRAWMLAPDAAVKEASAVVSAKGDLLRNAAIYYDALLRSENIKKDRAFKIADLNMQAGEIATRAFVDIIRNRSNAAVALAESTGHAASAALSSLNSMAQVSNITNT